MEGMLDRQDGIEVLGGAVDGEDAIVQAQRGDVDIILIKSLANTLNIVDTTKQVAASCGDGIDRPRVLVLANEVDEDVLDAIAVGASGVLLTSIALEELVPAIRIVDAGYLVLPPDCRRHSIIGRPADGALKSRDASVHDLGALTGRENDVLRLLVRGFSNAQISNELVLSESTVKSHVQHILTKLGLRNRVHVVILAYELGLVQIGQNPLR
jgi:DNA-binding NarL/FixJ family response regulator